MSTSRRRFLSAGLLAGIFAAVPFRNVLAQSWKGLDGNPGSGEVPQSDPLANYSKATFKTYLNSVFQVHTMSGVVAVTLIEVGDLPAAKGGEAYSLLFRGGSRDERQDTYTVTHPSLGTFQLFLVPIGTDKNGAQGYLATINRLSLADAANISAPTSAPSKRGGSLETSAKPAATPAPSPAAAPAVVPSAPAPAPVSAPTKKPVTRHIPSWKRDGTEEFPEIN